MDNLNVLLRSLKRHPGDEIARHRAFAEAWELYYRKVAYLVSGYCVEKSEREDLVQEVFLKVYRNLHRYSAGYAFSTWLYTVARNVCLDYTRKLKSVKSDLSGMRAGEIPVADSAVMSAENNELFEVLDRCIGTLSEKDRHIVFFHFYEGMKYKDIAAVMGIPLGTVKYRVFEIKEKLRKALEKIYGEEAKTV
jgi:RNA polymerase sigma-70 factor (ECF subfamily)